MTNALKNMIYNCNQATFLIEKRISGKITATEALQLQVHLAGCSVCKIYQQQTSCLQAFRPIILSSMKPLK